MKKLITKLALLLFLSTIVFAQNAPIDFEAGGNGADWTWTVFENDSNPELEIVANPDASGDNTSSTVAKFTALQTGAAWAGCESAHGADIGTFTLDETNCTIKIMVWKPVISDVGIKLVKSEGWSMGEIKVANTVVNAWEELTFDFSGQLQPDYDQIVVFPDFAARTSDNICYFDNITFSAQEVAPAPTVGAPVPTADAADVISLFCNEYTDITMNTWSASWDDANVSDVQIDGDDVKLYTDLNFAGIEFTSSMVDATEMSHFHMNIWTPDPIVDSAAFKIKLVDFGADGAWSGGDDVEHELEFGASNVSGFTSETWVSFDIPLTDFTGLTTTGHLAQLILVSDPKIVYVDNIFFHKPSVSIDEYITQIPNNYRLDQNYPNPFNPTTIIGYHIPEANNVTIKLYNIQGKEVASLVNNYCNAGSYEFMLDASDLSSGTYFYVIKAGNFQDMKKLLLIK